MARQPANCSSDQGAHRWQASTLSLLPLAIVTTLGGIYCLCLDSFASDSLTSRGIAGLLLLLSGIAQLLVVGYLNHAQAPTPRHSGKRIVGGTIAGGVVCYGGVMATGPTTSAGSIFLAGIAIWFTLIVWLTFVPSATSAAFKRLGRCRATHWTAAIGAIVILAFVFAETGLRVGDLVLVDQPSAGYFVQRLKPAPGTPIFEQSTNLQGFVGSDFQIDRAAGVVRIAVLGDERTISGSDQDNCLRRLDRQLPGVEIYNFAMPQAGPREYTALMAEDVTRYAPDLVLCFVSVPDDVQGQTAPPGVFDWQSLRLGRYASAALGSERSRGLQQPSPLGSPATPDEFLKRRARQLSICHTPMPPELRACWDELRSQMARLSEQCQRRDTPLGIVLLPGDFQVNDVLLNTLQQRSGHDATSIDVELPQRCLTRIAHQLDLPVLDLLPHLRATGATAYCHNQNQLSPHGNSLIAAAVGQWLASSYGDQIAALSGQPTMLTAGVATGSTRR